jgi:hypothetical protein
MQTQIILLSNGPDLPVSKTLYIPPGLYLVTGTVILRSFPNVADTAPDPVVISCNHYPAGANLTPRAYGEPDINRSQVTSGQTFVINSDTQVWYLQENGAPYAGQLYPEIYLAYERIG